MITNSVLFMFFLVLLCEITLNITNIQIKNGLFEKYCFENC